MDEENIYPVFNKWREKRATTPELSRVGKEVVMEALTSAYREMVKSEPNWLQKPQFIPESHFLPCVPELSGVSYCFINKKK
jgi:hypothetical protein